MTHCCIIYQPVDTIDDAVQFQNNFVVVAVHKWSVDWKMLFNDKKCIVLPSKAKILNPHTS